MRRLIRTSHFVAAIASLTISCTSSSPGAPTTSAATTPTIRSDRPSTGSPPAPSTVSPTRTIPPSELTGRIVFTRAGGQYGDGTIFAANADGSNDRKIAASCCPRWSWDGSAILAAALASDGQRITVQIIDPDGVPISTVPLPSGTLNLGPGTWAPDGQRLCFDGFGDVADEGLYVGNVSGGGLVRLTHKRGQTVDFTPDGERVVYFEAVPEFATEGNHDEPNGSLYVMNADGTGKSMLITPPDLQIGNLGGYIARLSRDGQWLVFAAEESARYGPRAIWKIHLDGSGLTKVFEPVGGGIVLAPTWSPDAAYVMFALDPRGTFSVNEPANLLAVVRADGSDFTPMLDTMDYKVGADWTRA